MDIYKDLPSELAELCRLKDKILANPNFIPYYPKGARRFVKICRPEEVGCPLLGTLFPLLLYDDDSVEMGALCKELKIPVPQVLHLSHLKGATCGDNGCDCHN